MASTAAPIDIVGCDIAIAAAHHTYIRAFMRGDFDMADDAQRRVDVLLEERWRLQQESAQ